MVSVRIDSEDLVQGFLPVGTILFSGLPFDVLIDGFFLPFFELPWIVGSRVVVGGSDDGLDKRSFEVVLQDFYGAVVIQFDVGVFD